MTEAPHPIQSLTTDYLSDLARRGEEHLVYQNASGILLTFGKITLFNNGDKPTDTSVFLRITPPISITPGIQMRLRQGDKQVEAAHYEDGVFIKSDKRTSADTEATVLEALLKDSKNWVTFAKLKSGSVRDWTGQRATPERLAQIKLTVEELGLTLYKGLQNNHDTPDSEFEDGHHV